MFTGREMPSPSAIFSTYASITTTMMLARSMANELVPHPIRGYLFSAFQYLFKPRSSYFTLVIEESTGISRNQLYDAAEAYLCTKVSPDTVRLKISKTPKDKSLRIMLEKGEKIVDLFDGIELRWRFVWTEGDSDNAQYPSRGRSNGHTSWTQKRHFELSFHKKHKDVVLGSYVPYVVEMAKEINDDQRVLKMHTLGSNHCYGGSISWDSVNLEHPSTFDTLAMEPELKLAVMEDLNRFVKRKEFYKKVGRAWKRGYLLYGPPGTGKSSLVAAMANYLKFDVYDLQLGNIVRDSDLRRVLLGTGNRSILVIEDIDCSVDIPDRRRPDHDGREQQDHVELTLSGLLNFIDGLWSSCGDERIIVFTTNHKDRLDPALLRPGRMDMHIHMSYCTFRGFEMLASNYLGIGGYHRLYPEIEALIDASQVTPAQVAEELLKSEDSDDALEGVVKLLKRKKLEIEEEAAAGEEGPGKAKRQRVQVQPKGVTRRNVKNVGKKRVVRKRYL